VPPDPTVDVIIPVHTAARPIGRAVRSVIDGAAEAVRVTVVCHNVDPASIAAELGSTASDERVRLLHLEDGIPSPAGPINLGLAESTAAFTALLDSDDTYEPGAVDSWMRCQRATGADVVIAPLTYAAGGTVRLPVRPLRTRGLDGVRDRLAYRTRQHGLVSRERFAHVRLTRGLRTGEDIEQGLAIWFSGASIAYDRRGPGYVIHEDLDDRTSASAKSVEEDFRFLDTILAPGWGGLTPRQREAVGTKLLRTHVLEAMSSRYLGSEPVPPQEGAALALVIRRILAFAPHCAAPLSRRDGRLLAAVLAGDPDPARLRDDLLARMDYRRPGSVLPASPARLLHREAPPRFLAALALS